jgi:hypothetical protein
MSTHTMTWRVCMLYGALTLLALPAAAQVPTATSGANTVRAARVEPAAWVGIAFSCRDCGMVVESGTARWNFSTPPEVYSVESGSPAHAAGIRRGDILTHIDNLSITTAEGGRRWAAVRPGESVRVRYRRPNSDGSSDVRTVALTPRESRSKVALTSATLAATTSELRRLEATLATRDSASDRLLRHYQDALREERIAHDRMLSSLRQKLATSSDAERRELETTLQQYMRQHEELRAQQSNLVREAVRLRSVEMQRAELSKRTIEDLTSRVAPAQAAALAPAIRVEQKLRYSGSVNGAEIVVRGVNPVVVTERGNELTITTHDSTITIRVPDRR